MSVQHGIVLGCPRSGTTYLMKVLNAVPGFECLNGTILPVAIPHVVNRDLDPEIYDALAVGFERALDLYLHSGQYHSRTRALKRWLRAPTGLGELVAALKGQRELPDRMIYKEPFLSLAPDFVLDALPDAKIVHLVRDGRDCANSLVRSYDVLTDEKLTDLKANEARLGRRYDHRYVPWWVEEGREQQFLDSTPYVRAIWMWKCMVRSCHESFSDPDIQESDRVLRVRYEEFMREPTKHGRAILEHFSGEPNPIFRRRLDEAHTRSIGKHQRRTADEIRRAEHVAGRELKLLGYDVDHSNL